MTGGRRLGASSVERPRAAGDKRIYVGDPLNHRVVRADKTWAAEETCALP